MVPMDDPMISELITLSQVHGVYDTVFYPDSHNTPFVHALGHYLTRAICHSIIDERSVGFYTFGSALATHREAVACCASGTAVTNLHPVVAEAYHRDVLLVILSVDRPERWVGQWVR